MSPKLRTLLLGEEGNDFYVPILAWTVLSTLVFAALASQIPVPQYTSLDDIRGTDCRLILTPPEPAVLSLLGHERGPGTLMGERPASKPVREVGVGKSPQGRSAPLKTEQPTEVPAEAEQPVEGPPRCVRMDGHVRGLARDGVDL